MTTQKLGRSKLVSLSNSRWAAYALAGAATAVGAHSAEGEIHYSGSINQIVNALPGSVAIYNFQLDQLGASFAAFHSRSFGGASGRADIQVFAFSGASVAGASMNGFGYASKLGSGINLNALTAFAHGGVLEYGSGANGQWSTIGTGFVGFRFNSGSGFQFGWARIHMDEGAPGNSFTLVDFAWADFGDQIATGQVPEPGSLGLLAVGAAGLIAWRKRRSKGC